MLFRRFPALLLVLTTGFACTSNAQTSGQNAQAGPGQIALHVTVDDRAGEPVQGLTAADFTLLDNKKKEPITGFKALTGADAQTEVIIVLDAVNLPYTRLSYARQQMDEFFSANGGKLAQPTTLAIVNDTGTEILPTFTSDGNALRSALDNHTVGLRSINRSAGFYGASERFNISLAALRMLIEREMGRPGRKRIVWVSEGWPLLSGPEVDLTNGQRRTVFAQIVSLNTELRRGQITIDAVNPFGAESNLSFLFYYREFVKGVRNENDAQIGNVGLQVLAEQSGGLVLNGNNDIAAMLRKSFDQTRASYEISFEAAPGERNDEYHAVQVQVSRPGLTVHTSTGYYARPTLSEATTPVRLNPTPVQ